MGLYVVYLIIWETIYMDLTKEYDAMTYEDRFNSLRSIDGTNGLYQIAVNGDVWSVKRNIFLTKGYGRGGYMFVSMQVNKKTIRINIHKAVAKAFIQNPDNKKLVHHKDLDKLNNHAGNLEWVTLEEHRILHYNISTNKLRGERMEIEEEREVDRVYIKEEDGSFEPYCSIEKFAEIHGMSRQSVYFKARYDNMPGRLTHVRIKKLYLIKENQEVGGRNGKVRSEVTNSVPA